MTLISEEKPVRVCFVSPKAYPLFDPQCEGVFGGAEVDLYLLGTELAKDPGFEASFITADYDQPDDQVIEGVTLVKSLNFRENALKGVFKIWGAMKKVDADIYFIKTVSLGMPLVAYFCRFHNKAFVYRTASILECNGQYIKDHCLTGKLFVRSLRQAKLVLTQNTTDRKNMENTLGIHSSMIRNGHRLVELSNNSRQTILWSGRSDSIKGPYHFLELAQKFPSEKFVMICQEATSDKSYDKLVYDAGQIKNLEFIERVPFSEVDDYFRQAKVVVNTSDSEGFANTFIQACNWGAAIVSLNANPDDFLIRYSCGVVCGGSMEHLVEGLEKMLDKDRYIEIGENGRKYVEGNHDITKIVKQYKQAFEQLL